MQSESPDPKWFLLRVRMNMERKVAISLCAKGFDVFLPMRVVRKQWSDRIKEYSTPLFANTLFCRFPLLQEHKLRVLKTPGVLSIQMRDGKSSPIPDAEIATLRRIAASSNPIEACEIPEVGDVVEIQGDVTVRGVLVEWSTVCRVAIGFDSFRQTVVLKLPLDSLKRVDGPLGPHWSLATL